MKDKDTKILMELYDESQIKREIAWIENKMNEVREQMKHKPSKRKQYMDLERQKKEREEKLKWKHIN